jgi:uncharacterized membrane protein (UPF0127 family)
MRPPHRTNPLLLLLSLTPSCGADTPATAPSELKYETVKLTIKDKPFTLEIADSDTKTERGLMFRKSMPADRGMLFIFDTPDTYSFWMHNTLIPLDIIYLDPAGKVVDIHHRKALDDTGMSPRDPARFVIELNAGVAEAIGLKIGDTIALPEKYLKAAPPNPDKKN